jgi:hypothetical protein
VSEGYENNLLARIISEEGDDFQRLQLESFGRREHVLVTLSNQRIYYGITTFEARHPKVRASHGEFRQLQIIPLISGFRDNKTKGVHLTDAHPPSFEKKRQTSKTKLRSMIDIPYSQIVSMQFVDTAFLLKNAVQSAKFSEAIKIQIAASNR